MWSWVWRKEERQLFDEFCAPPAALNLQDMEWYRFCPQICLSLLFSLRFLGSVPKLKLLLNNSSLKHRNFLKSRAFLAKDFKKTFFCWKNEKNNRRIFHFSRLFFHEKSSKFFLTNYAILLCFFHHIWFSKKGCSK